MVEQIFEDMESNSRAKRRESMKKSEGRPRRRHEVVRRAEPWWP